MIERKLQIDQELEESKSATCHTDRLRICLFPEA